MSNIISFLSLTLYPCPDWHCQLFKNPVLLQADKFLSKHLLRMNDIPADIQKSILCIYLMQTHRKVKNANNNKEMPPQPIEWSPCFPNKFILFAANLTSHVCNAIYPRDAFIRSSAGAILSIIIILCVGENKVIKRWIKSLHYFNLYCVFSYHSTVMNHEYSSNKIIRTGP